MSAGFIFINLEQTKPAVITVFIHKLLYSMFDTRFD